MHYLLIPYFAIFLLYVIFITNYKDIVARNGIVIILAISLLFLCGAMLFQPLYGDPWRYSLHFLTIKDLSFEQMNALSDPEYAYRLINWLVGQFTADYRVLFFVLFIIFISVFYKALKNIYPTFDRYYIFSAYILYPYFITYLVSGKRQGLGLVFMLLAISYFFKNQNAKGAGTLIIAALFHNGMLLAFFPIFLFVWLREKNILKIASIIYIVSLLVSISGLNEILANSILNNFVLDPRYLIYIGDTLQEEYGLYYKVGFRPDFTFFSLIPVFLYLYFRNRIKRKDKLRVTKWLGLYLLLNSIYQFFSFVPFSDRFAAFSWFILPIVSYTILYFVSKKYAILFTVLLLLAGVVLLQIYTYGYFLTPRLF